MHLWPVSEWEKSIPYVFFSLNASLVEAFKD